jgi:hypothetical protein
MKIRCFGCNVEKDTEKRETYPYDADGIINDSPIQPLELFVDVQGSGKFGDFKSIIVCHECFHKLDMDQWASREEWERLGSAWSYEDLPPVTQDEDKMASWQREKEEEKKTRQSFVNLLNNALSKRKHCTTSARVPLWKTNTPDPVEPPGEGWVLKCSSMTQDTFYWFWERKR